MSLTQLIAKQHRTVVRLARQLDVTRRKLEKARLRMTVLKQLMRARL